MVVLISKEDILNGTGLNRYGFLGNLIVSLLMKLLAVDWVVDFYDDKVRRNGTGVGFIEKTLNDMPMKIDVSDDELAHLPKEGAFITVSNHPFGLLDGLMLMLLVGRVRPDFKVMANFMLQRLHTIESFFIPVDPFEGEQQSAKSLKGVKITLQTLRDGHPVGFFPAGEVSTRYAGSSKIEDKTWQLPALRIMQKANVPIVPIFFEGQNSFWFHALGKIYAPLRTLQIVREFRNKAHTTVKVRIGEAISPEKQREFKDAESLGAYLRAKTYQQ